jgi:hypothetical protein
VARGTADDNAGGAVDEQRADEVLGSALATASERIGDIATEDVGHEASDRVAVEMCHVTLLRTVPS